MWSKGERSTQDFRDGGILEIVGSCIWTTESQGWSHGGLPLIQENFIIINCSKQCLQFYKQTYFRAVLERALSPPVLVLLKNIYHSRSQFFSDLSMMKQELMNPKKTSYSFKEVQTKSPRMLSIFLTNNNEVTYCRLFMKKLHSSLKAYLFYHFLEVLHICMLQVFYQKLSPDIHYI